MSRHEGVSCDSCLKTNFQCRRYKCLICYDYDLCANCYEEGVTSSSHLAEHPMQCILTRNDFDLYYGGEAMGSDQPQSFTCPLCKKVGFSESTLFEHVSAEHTDNGYEVVCPVCAAMPGGDSNLVTDDFAGHLTIEHRPGNRDLISFLDEPSAIRHGGVRRISHSGRPISGPRPRRPNSGLSVIYPVGRDPTAEILFQLSGGRLGTPSSSHLQQLQAQIQLERQQVSAARQQLERLPRIPTVYKSLISGNSSNIIGAAAASVVAPQQSQPGASTTSGNASLLISNQGNDSQFLLNRLMATSETESIQMETDKADKSKYILSLLLSTIADANEPQKQENREGIDGKEKGAKMVVFKVETATNTIEMDNNKIEEGMPPPPINQRRSVASLKKSLVNAKASNDGHSKRTNGPLSSQQSAGTTICSGGKGRDMKSNTSTPVGVMKKGSTGSSSNSSSSNSATEETR